MTEINVQISDELLSDQCLPKIGEHSNINSIIKFSPIYFI